MTKYPIVIAPALPKRKRGAPSVDLEKYREAVDEVKKRIECGQLVKKAIGDVAAENNFKEITLRYARRKLNI